MQEVSSKSTDDLYLKLRIRFDNIGYVNAKVVLDDTISELMREGRTREQAIQYLYENPEERDRIVKERKERETKQKEWVLIDASNCVLGKIAVKTATILMGKNKPLYTPHMDMGAYVIIVNAKKVVLTGKKWKNKKYYRHSGYPGGLKTTTAKEMRKKKPEQIIIHAVKGLQSLRKLANNCSGIHLERNALKKAITPIPAAIKLRSSSAVSKATSLAIKTATNK